MCDICGATPCDSRCPNATQEVVYICTECGEPICEDDWYWDSDDGPICERCMGEMSREEILYLCGQPLKKAEWEIEWRN